MEALLAQQFKGKHTAMPSDMVEKGLAQNRECQKLQNADGKPIRVLGMNDNLCAVSRGTGGYFSKEYYYLRETKQGIAWAIEASTLFGTYS